jgi:hypothetical protein
LDNQEETVVQVPKALQVLQEHRVTTGPQEERVLKVLKVLKVLQDQQGHQEAQVPKEPQEKE